MACDHIEWVPGLLGSGERSIGGDPRGIGFALPGERCCHGLIGACAKLVDMRPLIRRCLSAGCFQTRQ
ncbi:hypothetical protein LI90_3023 [Carbonactinospora thermoautotrophica]|uniref:Uncharacterized protein n=1 Tax=Carbonactinospora thermoautotrophica TaxID=1469144 RepID=A0A132MVP5_9ACTN|nr:hypothetical protein LI90_3023 [Carbonactinospora thermoautotrophica]